MDSDRIAYRENIQLTIIRIRVINCGGGGVDCSVTCLLTVFIMFVNSTQTHGMPGVKLGQYCFKYYSMPLYNLGNVPIFALCSNAEG